MERLTAFLPRSGSTPPGSSARFEQPVADTTAGPFAADLALALELADIADAVTLPHFRSTSLTVDRKSDRTEVTIADRGAEAAIRARLAAARPDHAVLGEEEGLIGSADAPARWIIDPIDGTSNFVKGVPIWATLIALQVEGDIVVGVCSAPALGRRWWAVRGGGAFADGGPIRVSKINDVSEAHLSHAGTATFATFRGEHGHDGIINLARDVWRDRGFGDFWMHMLVAEGAVDIAVEPVVNVWDLAAVQVIVEEAGGRFTNLDGRLGPDGGSALSTNGLLHERVLTYFV
jgi:histidinol-phosphatase